MGIFYLTIFIHATIAHFYISHGAIELFTPPNLSAIVIFSTAYHDFDQLVKLIGAPRLVSIFLSLFQVVSFK